MTEQEKSTIVYKLTKRIRKDGFIKLSLLKMVFSQENLNMELYPSSGLKTWVADNFPEFMIMGNHGYETIRMADDKTAKAWSIIESEITKNGKVLMSSIPGLLSNHPEGINYKLLADGQRLGEWIQSVFPDFKISDDNIWVSHTKETAVNVNAQKTGVVKVVEETNDSLLTEADAAEIQQMHFIAYMNWWTVNIKKIRVYNEEITEDVAKKTIAHQISKILLGMNNVLIDGMEESEPRIAFETGLKKANSNEAIYCVLMLNPKYENGKKQKFVQGGFCCAEDGTELGEWIGSHSKVVNKSSSYNMLEEKASLVSDELEKMTAVVEAYLNDLTLGRLPKEEIADRVAYFEKECAQLRKIYSDVWNASYPEACTVSEVKERVNEKNAICEQTAQAIRKFVDVITETHKLFDSYSLVSGDDSTMEKDREHIEAAYAKITEETNFDYVLSALNRYRNLREVMAAQNVVDEGIMEKVEVVSQHFSELSFKIVAKILVGSDYEEFSFLYEIESIEKQVKECKKSFAVQEKDDVPANERILADALLEKVSAADRDIVAIHGLTKAFCGINKVVHMLVFAELEALEEYFAENQNDDLYSEAGMERLRSKTLPTELSFWGAAERLYAVLGNYERLAECYYILGLLFDEEKNFHALLELYKREKMDDLYQKVFNDYSNDNATDYEEQMTYLGILCANAPSVAVAYSREHYFLMYQEMSLEKLLLLPEDVLRDEERQKLLLRKKQFEYVSHMNELETAILANDITFIKGVLLQETVLKETGYSDEEIDRIRQALSLSSDAQPGDESSNFYDIGKRFYRYQKNKNALAEYYMWKGIAENREVAANTLMVILSEEERWEECCKLYESARKMYSENSVCRMMYLLARMKYNPVSAMDYIRTDMQECLAFMTSNKQTFICDAINELSSDGNEDIAAFYGQIRELSRFLEDPLTRSIICLERSLREFADSANVKKLGVSDKFAATINSVYIADSYPHGMDAFSIASRIFAMVGTYNGAAEIFAKFALPDMKAVRLLKEIYYELEDEIALLALLQEYTVLREENEELFLNLLFKKEYYVEFIAACAMKENNWSRQMQLFIAELKVVPDKTRIEMPENVNMDDESVAASWYESWGALLTSTLYECDRLEDVEAILFQMFEGWTKTFAVELIRKIVTGNGASTENHLYSIQKEAVEAGCVELALYIYNVLKIGEQSEASKEYIAERMSGIDELSLADHLNELRRLRVIYGDTIMSLDGEIALLEIKRLLDEEYLKTDEKAEGIAEILKVFPEDEELVCKLIHNLEHADICRKPQIYNSLIALAKTEVLKEQMVLFFHAMSRNSDIFADIEMHRSVYSLYIDALMQGIFPETIMEQVEENCISHVRLYRTVESLLFLYFVKSNNMQTNRAEYILRILAEYPLDNMDETIGKTISSLLNNIWGYNVPSYFELFKKVLNDFNIDEIAEYLDFVNSVSRNIQAATVEISTDTNSARMLSEDDSNELIKQLYRNIDDSEIWNKSISLPIQDNPVAYSKLLYMNSRYNPECCEKCASYCEKYEQNDLLLDTFVIWANTEDKLKAEKCRKYLESRLQDNPAYMQRWDNSEEILKLIKAVCVKYNGFEQENHSLVRAVMLITEKSGNPEALKYALEVYKSEIFGQNCNLGVVLAANLILDKRYGEAKEILEQLKNVLNFMNYKELVDSLAENSIEELEEWANNIENRLMLQLILPDGNVPSLDQINEISDMGIVNGQVRETINAIKHILSMFKNDYGAYNAYFNLCCTDPMSYIPELHSCLQGLIRLRPSKGAMSYYRRTQYDYASMLATLDALCIVNQWTGRIEKYDFSKSAGEYYMVNVFSDEKTYQKGAAISERRIEVEASFRNRNEKQVEILTKAYLSAITGNWTEFILSAWRGKEDISFEINVDTGSATNVGLIRSVLRVLLEVAEEERSALLQWIQQMVINGSREKYTERYKIEKFREVDFVTRFYNEGHFELLQQQNEFEALSLLLLHPFEDYSLSGKWEKVYIEASLKKKIDTKLLFAVTLMIGALVKHPYFQVQLVKKADFYFENCNDAYAYVFYRALHEHSRSLYLQHDVLYLSENKETANPTDKIRRREFYEVRYRITALFTQDSAVMDKVKSNRFHTWSCLNMVLSLLYSTRADEILRLSFFFGKENKQLVEDILTAFDPTVNDENKLRLIESRASEVEKAYFCYVVKYPFNPMNRSGAITTCYALTNPDVKQKYNTAYIQCVRALSNNPAINKTSPSKILLLESRKPNDKAFEQKDLSLWNVSTDAVAKEKIMTEEEVPLFAKDILPMPYDGDIKQLLDMHKRMQNFAGNIHEKVEISKTIYQHFLAEAQSREELNDVLLMYGNDCYYSALVAGEKMAANQILLEITRILKYRNCKGDGTEEAGRVVQEGLLTLIKSAEDLQSLLECYGNNKVLLQYIRSLIMDGLVGACVAQVFSVLDKLRNCYASVTQDNQEVLREELSLNYRSLEEIETNRWMEMKNKVQKLINDEINELDQRPVLQFKVLNSGGQRNYGNLFGEVHNIGKIAAENIVIQASYSDNSSSNQYILKRLSPEGKAVFELDYSCNKSVEKLDYLITVSFSYSDKVHSSTVCRGTLDIEDIKEPDYPIGLLTQYADGIMFKVDEEKKEVFSPEFVGRKNETAMLRNLVVGEAFEDYKSALMYGVRRTGKTSLLNYFEAYIGLKRDSIIGVKTDCQSIPAKDPIQYVFIDRVIDTVERVLPDVKAENDWVELKQTWSNGYFCADQQPEKLSLFYVDVKEFIGDKGIFLIIDEIDRLFERVEQAQMKYHRNLDSLFGAISEILNSYACRKAVHLIICGSNWLIRYNLKGDRKNQLFQRFGKQVIEVGKLPENDAREVIFLPYRPYPELHITEEAVKWIWDYAGGLVWHTKLLGEEAVERARKDDRYVVYPSDVRQSMTKVITELWCKQFYEGCEDGEERCLVDAMQSLAAKKDAYVHINQITELMGVEKIEVQRIINVLIGLKIIAAHPIDTQLFRFELDIYRRYFRTNPSIYEKVLEEPDIFQLKQAGKNEMPGILKGQQVSVEKAPEVQEARETLQADEENTYVSESMDDDDSEWYD